MEALIILRKDKKKFTENQSEPQHGLNDLEEESSSISEVFISAQEV